MVESAVTHTIPVLIYVVSCIRVERHFIVSNECAVSGFLHAQGIVVIAVVQSDRVQFIGLHYTTEFLIWILPLCLFLAEVLHNSVVNSVSKVLFENVTLNTLYSRNDVDWEWYGEVIPTIVNLTTWIYGIEEICVSVYFEFTCIAYLSRSGWNRCIACFCPDCEVSYCQLAAECQIAFVLYCQVVNGVSLCIQCDDFVNNSIFVIVLCQGNSTARFSRIYNFHKRKFRYINRASRTMRSIVQIVDGAGYIRCTCSRGVHITIIIYRGDRVVIATPCNALYNRVRRSQDVIQREICAD